MIEREIDYVGWSPGAIPIVGTGDFAAVFSDEEIVTILLSHLPIVARSAGLPWNEFNCTLVYTNHKTPHVH